jgi:hypothetical protein
LGIAAFLLHYWRPLALSAFWPALMARAGYRYGPLCPAVRNQQMTLRGYGSITPPAEAKRPGSMQGGTMDDWRSETLDRIRGLIREAEPAATEERKWRKPSNPAGVPVWEHNGIICTGETYKDKVKLTFARGAALADPKDLFNSSLDGNVRRAIDIAEGATLDAEAFKALVREAVALNAAKAVKT